jgi:hypothetical protein
MTLLDSAFRKRHPTCLKLGCEGTFQESK